MNVTVNKALRGLFAMLGMLALLVLPALSNAQAPEPFRDEELDQMLAPIALYPDALLSQILMASTYPADVKDAAAWSKANPKVSGDEAVKRVAAQPWEPSVQSLVAFPQVLAMMAARPSDVQRLGDAFLADPGRLMDRVQFLRAKANAAGNLKSTEQQLVELQSDAGKQVSVIVPAQPQVVYVPVYQPTVMYGPWPYASYPPYYWPPPPAYYPGGVFVAGVVWGVAISGVSNSLWGGFNWGRNDVNINVNRYNNINVNRPITVNNNRFEHNAQRRRDVPYRDARSREQFGRKTDSTIDRDAFRGRDGKDADRARAAEALKARGADPAEGRRQLKGSDAGSGSAREPRSDRAPDRSVDRTPDRSPDRTPVRNTQVARAEPVSQGALAGARDGGAARANAERGRASAAAMQGGHGGGARAAGAGRHR
ncbi:MAG: DUF3300 domain-containing protein [Proteobacteria bacterium]|nr:DUF3300 domain-containing protein [Pseudomonadota bacterium]